MSVLPLSAVHILRTRAGSLTCVCTLEHGSPCVCVYVYAAFWFSLARLCVHSLTHPSERAAAQFIDNDGSMPLLSDHNV